MTGSFAWRNLTASALATSLLLLGTAVSVAADDDEHPVTGRWVVEAEPGGAVWAFQPSGMLVVSGPGEISAEGTWTAADEEGAFDASVEAVVTGQLLEVLGQVAPSLDEVALYVTATEPSRPDDWTPWPARSRLLGTPFGMTSEETPVPSAVPADCLRPEWVDGEVDWDRCDIGLTAP
jgi:hypothetical protein